MLGEYAHRARAETLMVSRHDQHPEGLAALRGARFVSASETDEGKRLSEAMVKDMTGGEALRARFMRQDSFEFTPAFKLWLSTNHKPIIRDTSHAMWRRLRLIPFTVTIPDEEQDKELLSKLAVELPGILAWAVRGCLAWLSDGLTLPDEVSDATDEYRAEQDVLGAFLTDACVTGDSVRAMATPLYHAYRTWADENGQHVASQTAFGTRLRERGFTSEREKSGPHKGRKAWLGIGLRERVQ